MNEPKSPFYNIGTMATDNSILASLQKVSKESEEGSYSSERDDAYAEIGEQIGLLMENVLREGERGEHKGEKDGGSADEEVSASSTQYGSLNSLSLFSLTHRQVSHHFISSTSNLPPFLLFFPFFRSDSVYDSTLAGG